MDIEHRAGDDFWPADDLPGLYETEHVDLAHLLLAEHYYSSTGRDWFVVEYDPAGRIAWGFVASPLAPDGEWGHIDLAGLAGAGRDAAIDRDRSWEPVRYGELRPAEPDWTASHAPYPAPAGDR